MAFNINPGKQQFSATAAQTVFTFNFAIFTGTDLKVYKTLAGAVANDMTDLLIISTHYTVSINGTLGGTVTLLSGASLNDTITVVRSLPITRTTDYVTNGDLYADTLDLDQDNQTYLVLDQNVQLKRALVVPESLASVDLNIPAPIANSYLRWNATANAIENDTQLSSALNNIADISIVAADIASVVTTATNIANVNTVASNIANVNATGLNIANVNAVGADLLEPISEINTVAQSIGAVENVGTWIASGFPTVLNSVNMMIGTIATLRNTLYSGQSIVSVTGYYTAADNIGVREYYWDAVSVEADNGGTIIQVTGIVTGRWKMKVSGAINAKWFGAKGDGVTDDTPSINLAAIALGTTGGEVLIPALARCLIDTALTIPHHVSIIGEFKNVGTSLNNTTAPYGTLGSCLIVNSLVTISLSGSASIDGVLIHRKGMTFPATDATLFAGTAITIAGDDAAIKNSMILGFNKAIYSTGYQRPRITDVQIDCVNGIEITQCADIAYINKVHCWPFTTIPNGILSTSIRTGIAFYLHDLCDWGKVTDSFSWGYYRGFKVTNANSVNLVGCGADNYFTTSPQHIGSIGFVVDGTSLDTKLIGCQSAAQESAGIYIDTSANITTRVLEHSVWGSSTHGILVVSGDCYIFGGRIRNTTYGVSESNASSIINVDGVSFDGIVTNIINPSVATTNIFLGKNDYFDYASPVGTTGMTSPIIASAAAITLPNNGDLFNISGTTNFGTLTNGRNSRKVTLMFSGILTVLTSTGAYNAMRLSGGANFTTSAGATLTLMHNGVQWYEIGRSA